MNQSQKTSLLTSTNSKINTQTLHNSQQDPDTQLHNYKAAIPIVVMVIILFLCSFPKLDNIHHHHHHHHHY